MKEIMEEMGKARVDVAAVQEIRWQGQDRMPQKDLHSRTGRDEKKGKTQERMERGSRKRFSSAGSENVERVGGR